MYFLAEFILINLKQFIFIFVVITSNFNKAKLQNTTLTEPL